VSINTTLARNEKVEHHIRIKTHKPIALRFWVESGISMSYVVSLRSHWCCISSVKLLYKPDKWYHNRVVKTDSDECISLYQKFF